jgi:predicted CopG family antitoxin
LAKSVKVHDDTHRALKRLKAKRRSASIDQVIREIIRESTGTAVGQERGEGKAEELTKYLGH